MRFPPFTEATLTPNQRDVIQAIQQSGRAELNAVQHALIHSPEVAQRVQLIAEELTHKLRVPERLRVLALIAAAGHQHGIEVSCMLSPQEVRDCDLGAEKILALSQGKRPAGLRDDEELVYDFCIELVSNGRVTSATFERVAGRFGREIVLELVALCGYAKFMTNVIRVAQLSKAAPHPATLS